MHARHCGCGPSDHLHFGNLVRLVLRLQLEIASRLAAGGGAQFPLCHDAAALGHPRSNVSALLNGGFRKLAGLLSFTAALGLFGFGGRARRPEALRSSRREELDKLAARFEGFQFFSKRAGAEFFVLTPAIAGVRRRAPIDFIRHRGLLRGAGAARRCPRGPAARQITTIPTSC